MTHQDRPENTSPPIPDPFRIPEKGKSLILLCLSLFLIVTGARWWVVANFGSDVPYWDQWTGEGANLFKLYLDKTLSLRDWLAPHNEHRILWSRLLSFFLLLVNGEWDARLQMEVNALLYTLVPCGLFFYFSRGRDWRFKISFFLCLALLFALPFAWENIIEGFQSQFCLLSAFSLAGIGLLLNEKPFSKKWAWGIASCIGALFTMGSGFFAPASVICVLGLLFLRDRENWRNRLAWDWPTWIFCFGLIISGLLSSVTVARHAIYKAASAKDYLYSLGFLLSWPVPWSRFFALILWAPFAFFSIRFLKGENDSAEGRLLLGAGFWTLLQSLALSYNRSVLIASPRYFDILVFGVIVNFLFAGFLSGRKIKRHALWLSLLIVLNVTGLTIVSLKAGIAIIQRKYTYEVERIHTKGFISTGNPDFIYKTKDQLDIPCPDAKLLETLLRDSSFLKILPVSLRAALPLTPVTKSPIPTLSSSQSLPPEELTPESWNRPGLFSKFVLLDTLGPFEYRFKKEVGLRFLYFYFYGDPNHFWVEDANGKRHNPCVIPSNLGGNWNIGFALCPTMEGLLKGTADLNGMVFMEPREIGPLSLLALYAAQGGFYLLVSGILLFGLILLRPLIGKSIETIASSKDPHRYKYPSSSKENSGSGSRPPTSRRA